MEYLTSVPIPKRLRFVSRNLYLSADMNVNPNPQENIGFDVCEGLVAVAGVLVGEEKGAPEGDGSEENEIRG